MIGWRAKIGLLVPGPNTVMEPDITKMCWSLFPQGITVHSARLYIPSEDVSEGKQEEGLELLAEEVEKGARELETAEVDVMLYGCTSGSFFKGPDWDKEIIRRIENIGKVPATTPATGMLEALEALNIKKLSVATPYSEAMDLKLKEFLEFHEYEVLDISGLRHVNVHESPRYPKSTLYNLVRKVDKPDSECIFISCTNLPVVDLVSVLEGDFQKPVITANQALLWNGLKKIRIHGTVAGYGRLLESF